MTGLGSGLLAPQYWRGILLILSYFPGPSAARVRHSPRRSEGLTLLSSDYVFGKGNCLGLSAGASSFDLRPRSCSAREAVSAFMCSAHALNQTSYCRLPLCQAFSSRGLSKGLFSIVSRRCSGKYLLDAGDPPGCDWRARRKKIWPRTHCVPGVVVRRAARRFMRNLIRPGGGGPMSLPVAR